MMMIMKTEMLMFY